jgi:hypothetical protein
VNFSEQTPSKQWAVLKLRGEKFAEVWFKPEGEPFALAFRIPHESFQIPDIGPRLTTENLLKAVGIAAEEVESWRYEGAGDSGMHGSNSELGRPLPPPSQDVPLLSLYVSLKPPQGTVDSNENGELEISEQQWQYLEGRWNAIRGLEASIDTLRMSMQSLQGEMETCLSQPLPFQAKLHALSSDMVQWDKAKSRVRYSLPKVREFLHRSTWATAAAERKKVEELFENHIRTRIAIPQIDQVIVQFESLLKDRQVLSAQGVSVQQECKRNVADVQGALRTLQSNAAANAKKKGGTTGRRGKSF